MDSHELKPKKISRMIAAVAGPYGRNYSQGSVGGILAELGFTSDQVRKL
jgi:cytochrome-b5 reductase